MSHRRKPNSRNPARQVTSTGMRIEAQHRHHAEIPTLPPGEHLWMAVGMWRLSNPGAERLDLDVENLMTIEGPGCFTCEQPYTAETAAKPCPGEPA